MVARSLVCVLVLAVTGVALSGCGTGGTPSQEQSPNYLTQAQLKELFSTTRTVSTTAGTFKGTGTFTKEGIADLVWASGSARGTWRIDGNKFCTKYPGLRRGYEACYSLQRTGTNTYTLYDGESGMTGTWVIQQ